MPEITLEKTLKEELIVKIQCYMEEELDKSLGSFEAEFLLDFFATQMGPHFYNQALADVLKGFDQTVETFTETVYDTGRWRTSDTLLYKAAFDRCAWSNV